MKKIILLTLALASSLTFFGQENVLESTGNIGIGTNTPSFPLSIGYNSGNSQIALERADGVSNFKIGIDSGNATVFQNGSGGGDYDFQSNIGGNGMASALYIDGSYGYTGIGTNTPSFPLSIRYNSGNSQIALERADGVSTFKIGIDSGNVTVFENGSGGGDYDFQSNIGGNGMASALYIDGSYGYTGIGTSNPATKLEVNGDISLVRSKKIQFLETVGGSKRAYISSTNGENGDYNSLIFAIGAGEEAMRIKPNGYVGIGSINPDSELTVKGKIHCVEVKVDLQVPADYVFEKYYTGVSELKEDYTMPTLAEVEAYTKENHHLPNIPSASEIKEEGLHLKEMTNLLLQKVEELTLYTIEQEKHIKAQEKRIKALEGN